MTESSERRNHWDNVFKTKDLKEVSWYEPIPKTSLDFLKQFNIEFDAKIIDVGGGDSLLVDNLLQMGYKDITVLDISENALNRAKERLGDKVDIIFFNSFFLFYFIY